MGLCPHKIDEVVAEKLFHGLSALVWQSIFPYFYAVLQLWCTVGLKGSIKLVGTYFQAIYSGELRIGAVQQERQNCEWMVLRSVSCHLFRACSFLGRYSSICPLMSPDFKGVSKNIFKIIWKLLSHIIMNKSSGSDSMSLNISWVLNLPNHSPQASDLPLLSFCFTICIARTISLIQGGVMEKRWQRSSP